MKKNSDVIVLNGRRYDAHSGKPLDGGTALAPRTARPAPAQHRPAHVPGATKTGHRHEPSGHGPGRAPARHVAAHSPEHSRTLMRRTVHKPQDSPKPRIKVNGRLGGDGRQSSKIISRTGARQPNTGRLQDPSAKRGKGRLISHFSPELFAVDGHRPAITYGAVPVKRTAVRPQTRPPAAKTWTTEELLEYAVRNAGAPEQPAARRRGAFLRRSHAHRR